MFAPTLPTHPRALASRSLVPAPTTTRGPRITTLAVRPPLLSVTDGRTHTLVCRESLPDLPSRDADRGGGDGHANSHGVSPRADTAHALAGLKHASHSRRPGPLARLPAGWVTAAASPNPSPLLRLSGPGKAAAGCVDEAARDTPCDVIKPKFAAPMSVFERRCGPKYAPCPLDGKTVTGSGCSPGGAGPSRQAGRYSDP